jgi:hypothetical protein
MATHKLRQGGRFVVSIEQEAGLAGVVGGLTWRQGQSQVVVFWEEEAVVARFCTH